jgi:hypothetical protein
LTGCRSFGDLGSIVAPGRGDNGHATADEVGHKRRQAVELAAKQVVLHRYVLPLDIPGFAQAFTERADSAPGDLLGRSGVHEADDRHRRLLRMRRERPRCRRSAERG